MIVVIDGPAGSGKSSTAKAVAEKLDIQYLDSGALYRAATLIYNQSNRDRKKFFDTLNEVNISFNYSAMGTRTGNAPQIYTFFPS